MNGLPALLADIAEDLGEGSALTLARELGGQTVKVPRNPEGSALERRVGVAIAGWLSERYAAEIVTIPMGPAVGYGQMLQRIGRAAADRSLSANEAARKAGCHVGTIKRRRGKVRRRDDDPDQTSLF